MKSVIRAGLAVAAVMALASPMSAADGLLITQTTTGGTAQTNQVQIEAHRMRVDAGGSQVVIFDGEAQVMRMIDASKKTYMEITKADVDRLGTQMNAMMAQMQEQLKNLPPEQRAQIEAMMRGRGAGPAMTQPAKTEYRRAGSDRVGAWTCAKYDGFRDGKKVFELCTVSADAFGVTAADFQVAREMAAFASALAPAGVNSQDLFAIGDESTAGFSGIPVRSINVGPPQVTTVIESVTRQRFADALFAVPEGYRKQTLPTMGR